MITPSDLQNYNSNYDMMNTLTLTDLARSLVRLTKVISLRRFIGLLCPPPYETFQLRGNHNSLSLSTPLDQLTLALITNCFSSTLSVFISRICYFVMQLLLHLLCYDVIA